MAWGTFWKNHFPSYSQWSFLSLPPFCRICLTLRLPSPRSSELLDHECWPAIRRMQGTP